MDSYVSFPALGWKFPIHDTIFTIPIGDGIDVKWYGLLITLGVLLAAWYASRHAKQLQLDTDKMIDVVMVCGVFAILGARLYYILFSSAEERAAFFAEPLTMLYIWKGGLAIYGGVIGAFGTALWMCKVKKVDTLRMFDIAAPGFLIGQALGRWGNFFNQEAYGSNTTLPWGMMGSEIKGYPDASLPVHPTFLYESLWCLLGLLVIHITLKKAYKFRGPLFSMYIVWYGAGRFFIEQLRTDSLYLGTMRVSCLVAAIAVIGGIVLFFVLKNREDRLPKTLVAEAESEESISEEPTQEAENNGSTD